MLGIGDLYMVISIVSHVCGSMPGRWNQQVFNLGLPPGENDQSSDEDWVPVTRGCSACILDKHVKRLASVPVRQINVTSRHQKPSYATGPFEPKVTTPLHLVPAGSLINKQTRRQAVESQSQSIPPKVNLNNFGPFSKDHLDDGSLYKMQNPNKFRRSNEKHRKKIPPQMQPQMQQQKFLLTDLRFINFSPQLESSLLGGATSSTPFLPQLDRSANREPESVASEVEEIQLLYVPIETLMQKSSLESYLNLHFNNNVSLRTFLANTVQQSQKKSPVFPKAASIELVPSLNSNHRVFDQSTPKFEHG